MSVDNPDDLLRRMLPNFMRAHDDMVAELHFLRSRVEEYEDATDEIESLKAKYLAVRAELDMRVKDKEID